MSTRKRWRFILAWAAVQLAVVMAAVAVLRYEWPLPAGTQALTSAQWPDGGRVVLPDDWRQHQRSARVESYALHFTLVSLPGEPLAIMLPAVRMHAVVALNGRWLGSLATLQPPVPRSWRRPMVIALPSELLRPGANRIEIRVAASTAGTGFLAAPILGPLPVLTADAEQRRLWLQTLPQIIAAGMAAVAALMLMLWWLRRHETVYLAYGLGMLAWAAHNLNFFVRQPPLSTELWETLAYLTLGAFLVATMFFIHRLLGVRRPRLERAFTGFVLLGLPLFAILPPPQALWFGDRIWNAVVLGFGLYLMLFVQVEAWRRKSAELQVLAASGVLIVAFGAHDLLISRALLPWSSGYMLHYAAAAPLLAFTGLMIVRFARSLGAVERMNEELGLQVDAAKREIEANQARLRELERKRWLSQERERIAQDMHDGVGGQLLSLVARARSGQLSAVETEATLTTAMGDLRLVIDSLEAAEGDLGTALATFRHRLERRLHGSGIALRWSPGELPMLSGFGPAEILHVLRLLDEAATNAMRHAGATEITIECAYGDGHIQLSLRDNGKGGAHESKAGHGLRNMHKRADQLGGRLLVDSGPSGTRLTLSVPAPASVRQDQG